MVLANDVSEGPDFAALAARGYRVFTIYHVDVVAYVSAIYFRSVLRPETTVRWYPRLRALLPAMARLVWEKQEASVRHSRGLIMPSDGMRETMLRCYPFCPPRKHPRAALGRLVHALLRRSLAAAPRISACPMSPGAPDLEPHFSRKRPGPVLDALYQWEQRSDFPSALYGSSFAATRPLCRANAIWTN